LNKILIINNFGIGDVLFTTPLIRNIRANYPDAFIGYVCSLRASSVLENNPCLNKIYIYEKDDYRVLWKKSRLAAFRKAGRAFLEIRRERFDIVFDFSLNRLFSFLGFVSGIPRRIGFNYKGRSGFLTTKIAINGFEGKHVVEHYLSLAQRAGIKITGRELEAYPKLADCEWAKKILQDNGIQRNDLLAAIVPGGGVSWGPDVVYRRWPAENHAKLADKIIEKFNAKIILLGDQNEQELAEGFKKAARRKIVDLIGKTTLGQYLALLAMAKLVVVNDGGPLHMAVAAGAKTVSLIGPVDENIYGPFPKDGHGVVTKDIACRPCYRQFHRADCKHISCIRTITVEEVFSKVEEVLKREDVKK